jgi:hypothetical protein
MEGPVRRPTGRRFRKNQPDLTIHATQLPMSLLSSSRLPISLIMKFENAVQDLT